MKRFYLLVIIVLCTVAAFSQKGIIKGIVFDTLAKKPVAAATVTSLSIKDSSLVSFTMSGNNGAFQLGGLPNGEYRLLITHVNYYGSNKFLSISDTQKLVDLGRIIMRDQSQTLDQVIVTADAPPVTLVGDTVQYNAGSFKTSPNSNVEQLLKKLPGIRVEKDGTVKAQGQEVKRILVDGKEFFGADPTIATRNLPADAVDKVQVFDRSSDQAQLTGFDDGNSEKTINLKLKKDKKKGWFGKTMAGGGTDKRFEGRFNLNSFKGARQFSAVSMANNINAPGFSFTDMMNNTGETNHMQGGGGGSTNIVDNNMVSERSGNNNNIRTIWGGGLNYNNIIGNRTDFTSNYFYNHYNPKTQTKMRRQNFLPGSTYFSDENYFTNELNNTHRVNLGADMQVDSFMSIKLNSSFGYQQNRTYTHREYENLTPQERLLSSGASDSRSNSAAYNLQNDLLLRKKFRQKGRTLSLAIQTNLNGTTGNGSLQSANDFYYPNGASNARDTFNQVSNTESDLKSYNLRLAYTEPMFKKTLLELSVGKSQSQSTSEKLTHDYNRETGRYDSLNISLTNDYTNGYGYNSAGARWLIHFKKATLIAGATWQHAELEGKIISGLRDSVISKSFNNLLPNARLQYRFAKYTTLTLSYTGITHQPSLSQLQPVADISDPLNIKTGNPNLKQEFSHVLQLNYMSANPFRNKSLFAFVTARNTVNKIVNNDIVDSVGRRTTRPVNVDGVYVVNGDVSLSLPVLLWHGSANFSLTGKYDQGRQFINGQQNDIKTVSLGPDVRLDVSVEDRLDATFTAGYDFNSSMYSIQSASNTTYFTQTYGVDVNWELPEQIYFVTGFSYIKNTNRGHDFNNSVPLWNASLSKLVLRNNRGELKLTAFDLLNRNVSVSRTSNSNYIEDIRAVTLQRYFLLSFTYNLTKTGLSSDGLHRNRIKAIF